MYSVVALALSAFVLVLLLTPIVRNVCLRRGWVDRPDGRRKLHLQAVPRTGGVVIVGAYVGAFALLLVSSLSGGELVKSGAPQWWGLLPTAGMVFLAGLVDDIRGLRPWHKLAVQGAAAVMAFTAGVQISNVAGVQLPLWCSLPLTVVWLMGCSNAFNLIDGVDGLAAGAALFATLTIIVGAFLEENIALAMAVAPLAGGLLGFLRYNFNPASIFLGDSGSLTVGYLLGCYAVIWGQTSATALGMTAPLMALSVPLLDTAVAIARRSLRGRPVFTADAAHIHHRLLSRGYRPRKVALLLYAACGVAATLSLLTSVTEQGFQGIVIVLFCAAAWMGVQHLGYVEFGAVGRVFVEGAFRRHLVAQMTLQSFEEAVSQARTAEQCWVAIRTAAEEFGYGHVCASLGGRRFATDGPLAIGPDRFESWQVRIPLSQTEYVNLERLSGSGVTLSRVGPFADAIQRILRDRFAAAPEITQDMAEVPHAEAGYSETQQSQRQLAMAVGRGVPIDLGIRTDDGDAANRSGVRSEDRTSDRAQGEWAVRR